MLKARRPQIYVTIGLGAHAVADRLEAAADEVPAVIDVEDVDCAGALIDAVGEPVRSAAGARAPTAMAVQVSATWTSSSLGRSDLSRIPALLGRLESAA